MKTKERVEARRLRGDEGWSVKEIASALSVAPSSVSVWVRDIALTDAQLDALRARNARFGAQNTGARANEALGRSRRRAYQAEGRARARRGDPLHLAGVMLYWAEGDKGDRHAARLANSDPELLRVYVRFLCSSLRVPARRLRVACNLFADHAQRQEEVERF
ncbi:MAG: hypothetical protein M3321_01945 [Actinomycetota bacterium]|nr:hypothetical protein [Actinomycetota bacterium]